MDFDDLETKEEELGPDDEILTKARVDPSWQEYVQSREREQRLAEEEEERARQQLEAEKRCIDADWQDFMMARRLEWERLRDEERQRRPPEGVDLDLVRSQPPEMHSWEAFMEKNPELFTPVYNSCAVKDFQAQRSCETESEEAEERFEGVDDEVERQLPSEEDPLLPEATRPADAGAQAPGLAGAARGRRRGAFSRTVAAAAEEPAEEPEEAEEQAEEAEEAPPPQQAGEDPTGLDPEDPTFAFVRKMIDTNRGQNQATRKQVARQEQWQAAIEDGVVVPYLADVLERIEEDEKADPDRQEEVAPLEQMLDKIEREDVEDQELEQVKEFLPDIEKKRQEWTLAICAPEQEVPLATPAIRVLQDMYPEQDFAVRDALESFEVAQSWHEPSEEGYLSTAVRKRAKAAADEQEWMAWKAKEETKRRLKKEGLAYMLPPAPKNSKIGSLPPSNPKKDVGGGSSSSSSGLARGVGGPRHAPLARAAPADPRPPRPAPSAPSTPAPSPAPPKPTPPQESEEDRLRKEELDRQERARLSKERLERMRERRRQREAGEAG